MTVHLTQHQQRRLQSLADQLDRVTRSDRQFFERHPHRQHRVRIASRVEIEQLSIFTPRTHPMPRGYRTFVIVKNVSPGLCLRIHAVMRAGFDVDVSELRAADLFTEACGHEFEAAFRRAAAERDRRARP